MKHVAQRHVVVALFASLVLSASVARAGGTADDPDYVWAWMEEGKIRLRVMKPVYKTFMEMRTATVDGQEREFTVCRMVSETVMEQVTIDGSEVDIFAIGSGAVNPDRWASLLKKPVVVLTTLDGRDLPAYYQTIFKPGTLVLARRQVLAMPAAPAFAPAIDAPPASTAPVPVETAPPPPAPSAPVETPVAAPAPSATLSEAPAFSGPSLPMPNGAAPLLTFASLDAKGLVHLRHVVEQEFTEMISVNVTRAGKQQTETIPIKGTIKQSVSKELAVKHVKLFVDGAQVFRSRLTGLLARDTLTLASRDGQPVDKFYTQLLKPGAIVLVAPVSATAGMNCGAPAYSAPAPMAAPAPFAPPPPAPTGS